MRTIKFRAFKVGTQEFVYGLLSTYKFGHFNIEGFEVETDTIGQFTGLYDSLGEEIFEGDILRQTVGDIDTDFTVVYNSKDGKFQKQFENKGGKISLSDFSWVDFEHSELKVIGNIHENK